MERLFAFGACSLLGPAGFVTALLESRRRAAREGTTTPQAIALLGVGVFSLVVGYCGAAWAPGSIQTGPEGALCIEEAFLPIEVSLGCCLPWSFAVAAVTAWIPMVAAAAFLVGWRRGRTRAEVATYLLLAASAAALHDLLASVLANVSRV